MCAQGNVYSSFRLKSNEFAKDAFRSSCLQEHKICHSFAYEPTVGRFTVVNSHINYLFMCALCVPMARFMCPSGLNGMNW